MGEKEPLDDHRVSHGICPDCSSHYQRQLAGLPLDEYLDGFDAPVLIVDADGRIAAANKMASAMMGKSQHGSIGLLGGEAMECAYARLAEGCGKTMHCETCTIRIAVNKAMETGETQRQVPVKLQKEDGEAQMIISTYNVDGFVRIVIEG
ncbi:hypothetical protein ACFL9U_16950 [Thermodesulfobacteriota bacterium]